MTKKWKNLEKNSSLKNNYLIFFLKKYIYITIIENG